jgi:hypothetical protein
MTRKSAGFILLAARILARAFFSKLAKRPRLPSLKITLKTKISSQNHGQIFSARLMPNEKS